MGLARVKFQIWHKCSKQLQEQRTRLYIMWRCSVILIRLKLEGVTFED